MSEQQPIPEVFQKAIEKSAVFADFFAWSEDVARKATTDPLFDPQELENAKFTDQENDAICQNTLRNITLLSRLEKVTREALETGALPLAVDYAQAVISSRGERFPASLLPTLRNNPEKSLEIMRMGHEFMMISLEAAATGFNLGKAIEFITSTDQDSQTEN